MNFFPRESSIDRTNRYREEAFMLHASPNENTSSQYAARLNKVVTTLVGLVQKS